MKYIFNKYGSPFCQHASIVYYDPNFEEFTVKFYKENKHLPDADYFTSDESDALGTAENWFSKGLNEVKS